MNPELLALMSYLQSRRRGVPSFSAAGPTGGFEGLFAGRDDPRLSFAENEANRRQALQVAGLSGFLSLGKGGGLLDVIGTTGLAGQEARAALTAASLEAMQPIDLETEVVKLENGQTILIDKRTGAIIADLGGAEVEEVKPEFLAPVKVQLPNGDQAFGAFDKNRGHFVDVNTGQIMVGATPVVDPVRGAIDTFIGQDGREYSAFFNPETGEQIGPARLSGLGEDEAGTEQGDLLIANQIEREVLEMERILNSRGLKPFGPIETRLAQNDFTRILTGEDVQLFNASAQNILSIVVKSRSGAQATEAEVRRLQSFAVPLPGDKPATVRAKMQRMRDIVNDLRTGGDPFDRVRPEKGGTQVRPALSEGNRFSDLVPER